MAGAANETEWAADRKVGFAMGILLIGVVAALFFRNEPLSVKDAPSVEREELIDSRLRDRDVSVYTDDREIPEDGQDEASSLQELLNRYPQRDAGIALPIRPAERPVSTSTADSDSRRVGSTAHDAPPFEPPSTAADRSGNAARDSAGPGAVSFVDDTEPADADGALPMRAQYDEYTVRYGDTLSGIADELLGAPGRYREIYDANRDRMASPDRLKVGTAIRIPRL